MNGVRVGGAAALRAFKERADAVSLVLMYLRDNVALSRPLRMADIKPRAVGHWGCTPGITAIWGAVAGALAGSGTRGRLIVGTGHAGLAWLACSYLDGSLAEQRPDYTADIAGLSLLARDFGSLGGLTTEVSYQYPGALWCGGELGHAIGVCHGLALADPGLEVVVVVGDGELETATTAGAFQAMRVFRTPNLHAIINDNGMRMGGASALSLSADPGFAQALGTFAGAEVTVCDDPTVLRDRLAGRMCAPATERRPGLLFFRNIKGDGLPAMTDGRAVAGTTLAHKAPLKAVRTREELGWLESVLRQHGVDRLFDGDGKLDSAAYRDLIPPPALVPARAERVGRSVKVPAAPCGPVDSMVGALTAHIAAAPLVVTSPDELSSNRCGALLKAPGVTVREYLSEHVCLYQNLGESLCGRDSWMITYEAFAELFISVVLQHLKQPQRCQGAIHLALTSLGWRNAYSHQAPGFLTSLLQTRHEGVRAYVPSTVAALRVALDEDDPEVALRVYLFDKHHTAASEPTLAPNGGVEDAALVVVGGYLLPQAAHAAALLGKKAGLRVGVVPLDELTVLYRRDDAAQKFRQVLRERVAHGKVILASCLYPDVLAALWNEAVGRSPLSSLGYVSQPNSTAGSSLLAAGCTWMQLARAVLDIAAPDAAAELRENLDAAEEKLRRELDGAWDDPAWFDEQINGRAP